MGLELPWVQSVTHGVVQRVVVLISKRNLGLLLSVFLVASLTACKVSEDAVAASQQMTATSAALDEYYGTLDAAVGDTIALFELDAAQSGIPYTKENRSQQEAVRAELQKRREMAEALGRLSASMAALTKTTAPSDVADAATKLGNELVSLKALPSGSPVPDGVGKAGNFLIQLIQQHEEKKRPRLWMKPSARLGTSLPMRSLRMTASRACTIYRRSRLRRI